MPQSVPVAAPSPAPVVTPPAPAPAAILPPPPTRTSNSSAPIPPRVSRELEHEGGTWRCSGGRVARPVHCAMRHGIAPIVMVYHWATRLWCQRKSKQPTRLFAIMAPPRTRRICRPRMHQICLHPTMRPTWRSRPMQTYGDTPCTRNSGR